MKLLLHRYFGTNKANICDHLENFQPKTVHMHTYGIANTNLGNFISYISYFTKCTLYTNKVERDKDNPLKILLDTLEQ